MHTTAIQLLEEEARRSGSHFRSPHPPPNHWQSGSNPGSGGRGHPDASFVCSKPRPPLDFGAKIWPKISPPRFSTHSICGKMATPLTERVSERCDFFRSSFENSAVLAAQPASSPQSAEWRGTTERHIFLRNRLASEWLRAVHVMLPRALIGPNSPLPSAPRRRTGGVRRRHLSTNRHNFKLLT